MMKNVVFGAVLILILTKVIGAQSQEWLSHWPPIALIIAVIIGAACLLGRRGPATAHCKAHGRATNTEKISIGIHEVGHGLAAKKGGMKLKKMQMTSWGGYTRFDPRGVDESSPEYLRTLMAGAEAQAAYLVKRHGYSWSAARAHAARSAQGDMTELRRYADRSTEAKVRKETAKFIASNWRSIERNGNKLAARGKMTYL